MVFHRKMFPAFNGSKTAVPDLSFSCPNSLTHLHFSSNYTGFQLPNAFNSVQWSTHINPSITVPRIISPLSFHSRHLLTLFALLLVNPFQFTKPINLQVIGHFQLLLPDYGILYLPLPEAQTVSQPSNVLSKPTFLPLRSWSSLSLFCLFSLFIPSQRLVSFGNLALYKYCYYYLL